MRRAFLSCQFPMPNEVKERQGTRRFDRRAIRPFLIDDEDDGENKSRHKNAKNTPWIRPQFSDTETSSDDQDEV